MFSVQPTTFPASGHRHSLIERVLHLRQQLGIDIPLSIDGLEEHSSPREQQRAMEAPGHMPALYDRREWLTWSESPGEGNPSK